jgi:glutathione S-transferase
MALGNELESELSQGKSGDLTLISHHLCPYVQRAAIALHEKAVAYRRIDIDLANKPDWFLALSPLGKTPVLKVGERAVFESAVIVEYLEDTEPDPLHPADPLRRAEHRAWIEYASAVLNDIAAFYSAGEASSFDERRRKLVERFRVLEGRLKGGPWFDGQAFSLVDAAFGPVFRYFDVFDQIADFGVFGDPPKTLRWRAALAVRPSVMAAVGADYEKRLRAFLRGRGSHLSRLMEDPALV